MTADWLATVCSLEYCTRSWVTLDLVGHKDGDVEFYEAVSENDRRNCLANTFSDRRQLREKLVKLLLTLIQFATTGVVDTKECHDAVDDEKAVLVADEELGDPVQQLHLMFRIDSTGIGDIVLGWPWSAKLSIAKWNIPVSGSTPKRSAICAILSGLNVPSVSDANVSDQVVPRESQVHRVPM